MLVRSLKKEGSCGPFPCSVTPFAFSVTPQGRKHVSEQAYADQIAEVYDFTVRYVRDHL